MKQAFSWRWLLPLVCLSGCGYTSHYSDPTKGFVLPAINGAVDQIIAGEAQQAVAAQRTLAMIKRAQNPALPAIDPNNDAPGELLQKITVANYTGPIGGFVKELARQSGYKYVVPQIDIEEQPHVSLNIENRTIAEALDDCSLQVQNIVQIVVNPEARTMTLHRYFPSEGHLIDNGIENASIPVDQAIPANLQSVMSFDEHTSSKYTPKRTRHIWRIESSHS